MKIKIFVCEIKIPNIYDDHGNSKQLPRLTQSINQHSNNHYHLTTTLTTSTSRMNANGLAEQDFSLNCLRENFARGN